VNFTSFSVSVCGPEDPWHSPSNAHAYRLYVFKERRLTALLLFLQRRQLFCLGSQVPVKHSEFQDSDV
jgi:hypothetical protein